jgi:hypothetical protein
VAKRLGPAAVAVAVGLGDVSRLCNLSQASGESSRGVLSRWALKAREPTDAMHARANQSCRRGGVGANDRRNRARTGALELGGPTVDQHPRQLLAAQGEQLNVLGGHSREIGRIVDDVLARD